MKTKSLLLAAVLAVVSIAGLAHGQTAPTSYSPPPVQKLGVSHLSPDGFTATIAVVQAPRFTYDPITATASATISVVFYKDAAAITARLRPADFKTYSLTTAQTASALSPSAITTSGGTPLAAAVNYLLALSEYSSATKISP